MDTDDYNNVTPEKIQNSKNIVQGLLNGSNSATKSWLSIAHDIHQQTALNLTAFMLNALEAKGYTAVTLGKCLNDPEQNWYRNMEGGPGIPPSSTNTATPTSTTPPNPTCTVYSVGNWCATPLPKHTTIPQCWAAVDSCWTQGSLCWDTVPWPTSANCELYQGVCAGHEAHCQNCADTQADPINGPCAQFNVVYPPQ